MNVDGLEAFLELGVAVAPHVAKRVPAAARYVSAEYRFEFLHGSHAHHIRKHELLRSTTAETRSWTSRPTRASTPVTTTATLTRTALHETPPVYRRVCFVLADGLARRDISHAPSSRRVVAEVYVSRTAVIR